MKGKLGFKYALVEYSINSLLGEVVFESLSRQPVEEMKKDYETQGLSGKSYKIKRYIRKLK